MKKIIVGFVALASMTLAACGNDYPPQQPMQDVAAQCVQGDPNCAGQVVQQGGSFIQEHPIATAAVVGAGAYMLGKRNERRNNYGYGYNSHRPVVVRKVYRRPVYVQRSYVPSVTRTYSSRPAYRTVTRTTTYRRR